MLQLEHSGNFLSFPAKPGLPVAPQHSTSEARAPHSPPAQYQRSQGSPQPPSKVPAKPGFPTAPQYSTSEARAPHSPQHSTSEARAPHIPSTVPAKPGLPTVPQHSTSEARAPTAPPVQYQPPGTITGTACLSPVPEEAPSHQGPSQGLPASLQCQKKLPATRDHHRDCLPLSQHQKKLPATGDHHRACLSSVNIHWIFIHSNWKHHD